MNANEAPQCSTLRRHWQAMQNSGAASATPTQQATPAAASPAPTSSGGGFFSWLKSLFS